MRKLVIEIALANEGWGYTKIRDALLKGLKIEIGRSAVADILKEAGIEPAPERFSRSVAQPANPGCRSAKGADSHEHWQRGQTVTAPTRIRSMR